MHATLAVNNVTTTGDSGHIGRLVIGQIHAGSDEPIRLYYRKLPNNTNGSIYFAHEVRARTNENGLSDSPDVWVNIIGSRSNSQSDPADGIPLNEAFSYEIVAVADNLMVTITTADGTVHTAATGDNSGFDARGTAAVINSNGSVTMDGYNDQESDYMYFKAGIYTGNSSGDAQDYDQITLYSLDNLHP